MKTFQEIRESLIDLNETNAKKSVQNKADETGIPFNILWDVYRRGVGAWRTGHRPGTTPEQWGLARINSFVTGGKTRSTADADLWKKYKTESVNEASIYDFLIWEPTGDLKTIADNLDKLKPGNNELYRGMSAKEYEEFKNKQFVTSKGYGNTRNIKASYVSDNIHLASRFALVAYRDKGEGYLMILDRNKLPDLEKRDQTPAATNYSTPHIPKDSIKKVIQLSKLK